jgi:hypothetical protein
VIANHEQHIGVLSAAAEPQTTMKDDIILFSLVIRRGRLIKQKQPAVDGLLLTFADWKICLTGEQSIIGLR